jgi:hypothetical protein
VWKGVWQILKRTPSRRLDDKALAIELNVQQTAARQYRAELTRLGILNEDGTPTDLAGRWRQDGDDPQIITEILQKAYPQELLELAPPDDLDRDKVVRWFMSQNLGEGAAKNKASTYMRVASGVSSIDAPPPAQTKKAAKATAASSPRTPVARETSRSSGGASAKGSGAGERRKPDFAVNVQIHISADATTEQIDAIFAAMSRYFDDSAS